MPTLEAKSLKHLGEEVDFLVNQQQHSANELVALRREHRVAVDRVRLELETVKRFLFEARPDLRGRYEELAEEVRQEVDPE